jgi:hypothetical protein
VNLQKLREELDDSAGPEVTKERLMKALQVIEKLAERELTMEEPSSEIYEVAHIAQSPACFDSHEEWEERFQELVEEFGLG